MSGFGLKTLALNEYIAIAKAEGHPLYANQTAWWTCDRCRGVMRAGCNNCGGRGGINQPSVYVPKRKGRDEREALWAAMREFLRQGARFR